MRRVPLLLAAAAAVLAGCSPEDPDDVFYYLGSVKDLAGAPLAGASVTLETEPPRSSGLCSPTDRTAMGWDPQGGRYQLQDRYEPARETTANQEGVFYFDLMRFEINYTYGDFACLAVSARGQGGAMARSTSHAYERDQAYPDLVVWDGAAPAVAPGTPARVSLPALPWAPSREGYPLDEQGSLRRVLYDWALIAPGEVLAWHQVTESDPLLLDPELLQDFPGLSVRLEAWIADTVVRDGFFGGADYFDYRTMVQTPPVAVSVPGIVPASRGAACAVNGKPLAGCPLTDGSLELAMLPSWLLEPFDPNTGPPPGAHDEILLELAGPIAPRLLVVHEIHGPGILSTLRFKIEGSADGSSWIELAPEIDYFPETEAQGTAGFYGSGAFFKVGLDSVGEPIQKVRLATAGYTGFVAAREISIFE